MSVITVFKCAHHKWSVLFNLHTSNYEQLKWLIERICPGFSLATLNDSTKNFWMILRSTFSSDSKNFRILTWHNPHLTLIFLFHYLVMLYVIYFELYGSTPLITNTLAGWCQTILFVSDVIWKQGNVDSFTRIGIKICKKGKEGGHSWCQSLGKDSRLIFFFFFWGGECWNLAKCFSLLCHFWMVQNFHHFEGLTNPSYFFCYSISVFKKYELSNQTCK